MQAAEMQYRTTEQFRSEKPSETMEPSCPPAQGHH